MVLPSYFLDNEVHHAREIIHHDGSALLAAFRLPDDLFSDARVTVDIVFLYKGATDKRWLKTQKKGVGGYKLPINEYFVAQHPEHIIGGHNKKRKAAAMRRRFFDIASLNSEGFISGLDYLFI